jgi:hypothetical protein
VQEAKVAAASRFQMVSIFIFFKLSTLKCKILYNVSIFKQLSFVLHTWASWSSLLVGYTSLKHLKLVFQRKIRSSFWPVVIGSP